MTALLTFEIGKTYGGYTVESRTKCFVTFDGCTRKKVIVIGVEQVSFSATERLNGAGQVVESIDAFTIAAFAAPSDIEIYSPVATDDNTIVITDGGTDLKLMSVNTSDQIAALVPVNEAKDPAGRSVRLIAVPVLQAIVAKPTVPSAEIAFINITSSPVAVAEDTPAPSPDNFWTSLQVQIVPNFSDTTVANYKASTDSKTFVVGQTYESADGELYTVVNRLDDTLQIKNRLGHCSSRNIHTDSSGEFVRPNLDARLMYAGDTPAWFYGNDNDIDFNAELALAREQKRQDTEDDRVLIYEPQPS
jgi:hypothetical protein